MRPVNLLPEQLRPRQSSGSGSSKQSYVVLGVLGLMLLGVVLYVVTANQVTTRKAETEKLRTETYAAQQRAGALAQFGSFQQTKEIRLNSVAQLSAGRFDWERMSRELSRVLPAGVFLEELRATATGDDPPGGSGSSSAAASSSSAKGPATEEKIPYLMLKGCAPDQSSVAETLVRLRRLHQADDVSLVVSERPEVEPSVPGGSGPGAAPEEEGCGATAGRPNYTFEVKVKLAPTPDPTVDGGSVPRTLGGGS